MGKSRNNKTQDFLSKPYTFLFSLKKELFLCLGQDKVLGD